VSSRRAPMLIRPAIGDTDPIRYRRPNPDGQFSGNILDEAMRPIGVALKCRGTASLGPPPRSSVLGIQAGFNGPLSRYRASVSTNVRRFIASDHLARISVSAAMAC